MTVAQIYILISIVLLAIIAVLDYMISNNKKGKKLTLLTRLAFGFVLAGILLGSERLIGYSFLGVGVLLAVVDMIKKGKERPPQKFMGVH